MMRHYSLNGMPMRPHAALLLLTALALPAPAPAASRYTDKQAEQHYPLTPKRYSPAMKQQMVDRFPASLAAYIRVSAGAWTNRQCNLLEGKPLIHFNAQIAMNESYLARTMTLWGLTPQQASDYVKQARQSGEEYAKQYFYRCDALSRKAVEESQVESRCINAYLGGTSADTACFVGVKKPKPQ